MITQQTVVAETGCIQAKFSGDFVFKCMPLQTGRLHSNGGMELELIGKRVFFSTNLDKAFVFADSKNNGSGRNNYEVWGLVSNPESNEFIMYHVIDTSARSFHMSPHVAHSHPLKKITRT